MSINILTEWSRIYCFEFEPSGNSENPTFEVEPNLIGGKYTAMARSGLVIEIESHLKLFKISLELPTNAFFSVIFSFLKSRLLYKL